MINYWYENYLSKTQNIKEILQDLQRKIEVDLQPRIEKRVHKELIVCSDTWQGYTGIAVKGCVYRLINHSK